MDPTDIFGSGLATGWLPISRSVKVGSLLRGSNDFILRRGLFRYLRKGFLLLYRSVKSFSGR